MCIKKSAARKYLLKFRKDRRKAILPFCANDMVEHDGGICCGALIAMARSRRRAA